MNKTNEIRELIDALLDNANKLVGENCTEEIYRYLQSAALRIWASNMMYADAYVQVLSVFEGKTYTAAQIMTVLDCAGEPVRQLAIPTFLQKTVQIDLQKGTYACRDLIEQMGRILAELALINGNFTIREASVLKTITDYLMMYAQVLLRTTNATIPQIAECVGFSSAKYFREVFKRNIGISPQRYRNREEAE